MNVEQGSTGLSPSSTVTSTSTFSGDFAGLPPSSATDGASVDSNKPKFILFNEKLGKVYDTANDPLNELRFYLPDENIEVTGLTWSVVRDNSLDPVVDEAKAADTHGSLLQEPKIGPDRAAKCNPTEIVSSHHKDLGLPMVIGIKWTYNGTRKGITYSPAFSLVEPGSDQREAMKLLRKSHYNESREEAFDPNTSTSLSTSASTTAHTSAALPLSTGSNSSSDSTSDVAAIGGSHGRGGLSTGAIAGIVVGVVVAAGLAAALCFFFFLRRRRSKTAVAAREDQTRAEQEKLSSFPKDSTGGAANASDAAIAPYRDEHTHEITGARGLDAEENPVTVGAAASPHGSLESGSRAEGQHGVSRHLVEDGMTAAEIRRLEEEEAHLDNEIQRAGGRR